MEPEAHDNWAEYYDYVYERTYGPAYTEFNNLTLNIIKANTQLKCRRG